jgi:hypothetical protein
MQDTDPTLVENKILFWSDDGICFATITLGCIFYSARSLRHATGSHVAQIQTNQSVLTP